MSIITETIKRHDREMRDFRREMGEFRVEFEALAKRVHEHENVLTRFTKKTSITVGSNTWRILDYMKDVSETTILDVATALVLSPVSVSQYMNALVKKDLLWRRRRYCAGSLFGLLDKARRVLEDARRALEGAR